MRSRFGAGHGAGSGNFESSIAHGCGGAFDCTTTKKMNASHLTVRNVPPELSAALDAARRRRGGSLNQTVIELLRQALGVGSRRHNGLARFAGRWSEAQWREFEEATEAFEKVYPELWR